jgi:hypothetical protein
MENEWAKMFDPPSASPFTPELLAPTNPVPEVMLAAGFQNIVTTPRTVQRDLLNTVVQNTWDNRPNGMRFMTFRDNDNPNLGGNFPGGTIRIPRGVVFHCFTSGKGPPPHTIHWHGQEPTPMNDGVGHCSFEIGSYTYQLQPNFIGTYFHHCHRNTVQHFEFGLYGLTVIEPPDAYFASVNGSDWQAQTLPANVQLNGIKIGACSDGNFRSQANLTDFPGLFPGWIGGELTAGNPPVVQPLAMTVPHDVEAIWVPDDRDSTWSDLAADARQTFPKFGATPGVDDSFNLNPGVRGFFAFNDYHADYWYVTGVPVPAPRGGRASIPQGLTIPPAMNSGVSGSQVSVDAQVGQTILLRYLNAAYNTTRITLPVDAVITAWDGRSLGIPPLTRYNRAYLLPANTPQTLVTGRRFNALIRPTQAQNTPAKVEFLDTRGGDLLFTADIPFRIRN